jgi:Anti-sigma factor NepR
MREAITRELQALYRAHQDEPLPERLTNLLRQLARERIQQVQATPHRSLKVTSTGAPHAGVPAERVDQLGR